MENSLDSGFRTLNSGSASATAVRNRGRVHVAGIGGVGMSALAQALLDCGTGVSGSDRLLDAGDTTATLQCLHAQGTPLFGQDGSGVSSEVARVVASSAIEEDNPDLEAARRLGIPIVHRSAELARLLEGLRLVAVTGTSGKSTVTAILGWLLAEAGYDPLVVNGAAVIGWDAEGRRIGSVRRGTGEWAVIEADESDRSLLRFKPQHAIITNCSADHFDLEATRELFNDFRRGIPGHVVTDQPPADAICDEASAWCGRFVLEGTEYTLPLPGRHNIANAWQAVRMARALGADPAALAAALATFPGVERRLQRVGTCRGAVVIDDYAHNPAKLAAAWRTVAAVYPRITALWRPHGYGPLRAMMEDLAATFATVVRPGDLLLVAPVYDAGGTARRDVAGGDLVARLTARGVPACGVSGLEEAGDRLRGAAGRESAILICGARDPGLPRLARHLAQEEP